MSNLPSTANLFSLLETTQADTVSDRFFGGVNAGEAGRLGVFLTPWSQTTFRIDDVDVTSPAWGGALFAPSSLVWQTVRVTSGMMPADTSGPGLLVALEPLRPPSAWSLRADLCVPRAPRQRERWPGAFDRSARSMDTRDCDGWGASRLRARRSARLGGGHAGFAVYARPSRGRCPVCGFSLLPRPRDPS